MALSSEELERYDRQIRLFGVEGQEKLKKSRVLVVGVGGLGSPAALYLVATGIGEVILVDSERVELSNLNRQVLYWTRDIGKFKVESASEKLRELNPNVRIRGYSRRADEELLDQLVHEADLVIDGLDNWKTRFMLNRICVKYRKPLIHAGVYGVYGQLLVVVPGITPCLQCVMVKEPPERGPLPVLGTTPGLLAMIQVTEAIKILTGYGEPALNRLIVYNGYTMEFREVTISRNPNCPVCGGLS
ncbi:MAG: HesA/MoeB/ThiF family protein [Desulfurococcaceae archaeon]